MANLTITVDDKVLKRARLRALEQGTSVNAILAERLRASRARATHSCARRLPSSHSRRRTAGAAGRRGRKSAAGAAGPGTSCTSDARTFIDTNVLTYLFDDAEPRKQAAAARRLKREQGERELVVSTQVLQELYVSLTKGRDPIATPEIAERAVHDASGYTVVHIDTELVFSAIDTCREHQLSFRDSLILRAAAEAGCDRLLPEDRNAGQVLLGVTVDNRFAG